MLRTPSAAAPRSRDAPRPGGHAAHARRASSDSVARRRTRRSPSAARSGREAARRRRPGVWRLPWQHCSAPEMLRRTTRRAAMRWEGNRESDNVEDRRDDGSGAGFAVGGRHIGIGAVVVALLASYFFGINPMTVLSLLGGGAPVAQTQPATHAPPADDQMARFVSTVLAATEDVWTDIFSKAGASYVDPKLVLFHGATPTACGQGEAAMGPFYCPVDRKVYIDLDFYRTLKEQLGAPGEFAEAYVIAHEVGHHVQNLTGISAKVEDRKSTRLN